MRRLLLAIGLFLIATGGGRPIGCTTGRRSTGGPRSTPRGPARRAGALPRRVLAGGEEVTMRRLATQLESRGTRIAFLPLFEPVTLLPLPDGPAAR
jgi:hypothetical protein